MKLKSVCSYKSVADEFGVSPSNVMRLFKAIKFPKPSALPEVLGIDEFKGNSGKQKYRCIMTDLKNGKVIDILHTHYEKDLIGYFKGYDRSKLKYFVSDMYKTYSEIAKTYFPNAVYITDRYHWVRQTIWAFENVRKEVQKKFSKTHRKYFKKSRKLLLKREKDFSDEQRQQVNIMLYASADLSKIQIMFPFCCHRWHKHGENPLFTGFFTGVNSFPLAPENCDLNNFVWTFLLILSGVFRLSIKYVLSRFLLSLCCHARGLLA